jgi:hypothetical protein
MPSSEELDAVKTRQEMEDLVVREQLAKIQRDKEAEKKTRKETRNRYLQRDLTFDEMFKQSCARVYYMKTNRENLIIGGQGWEIPPVADKLLSRFKYNKKHADQAEMLVQSAIRINNQKMIDEYKTEADKYLTKCLHAHYGIGVLYGQFMDAPKKVLPSEVDEW